MLSPLEKSCLRWVSRGKTLAEIALIEGKSVPEVQLYLQRALVALEAKSINEAIEKTNLSQCD